MRLGGDGYSCTKYNVEVCLSKRGQTRTYMKQTNYGSVNDKQTYFVPSTKSLT